MDYPAIPARPESTHPVVNRVLCGRFNEGPQYATWRVNGTDDHLLIHTISGSGRIGGLEGELVVAPGDSILLRPGVRHDYGTAIGAPHWELAFAHFHPRSEWIPMLTWPLSFGAIGHIPTAGDIHHRVVAALRMAAAMRSGAFERGELFAVNALEEALLWLDTQNPLNVQMDERVMKAIEYIGSHLADPLNVKTLATVAHLSPSRLSHLFVASLGYSPQRYLERERMLLAQQLLDLTDRSIADIAGEIGYYDPLYFSRRFREFARTSPTDYRARRVELT